ncbi:MAG: hypothetical protein ABIO77_01485, partial [Ginsengibacter sp.]
VVKFSVFFHRLHRVCKKTCSNNSGKHCRRCSFPNLHFIDKKISKNLSLQCFQRFLAKNTNVGLTFDDVPLLTKERGRTQVTT